MHDYFKNLNIQLIAEKFFSEEACLIFLSEVKWSAGFICKKCGNTNYCKGNLPHSRRCTRCKFQESATAHTTFHGCKVPLPVAFRIAWYVCNYPDISLQELSEKMNLRLMTVWKLRNKIKDCFECNNGFLKPQISEQK